MATVRFQIGDATKPHDDCDYRTYYLSGNPPNEGALDFYDGGGGADLQERRREDSNLQPLVGNLRLATGRPSNRQTFDNRSRQAPLWA